MNVIITGGCGFIGCNLADALRKKAAVTVIDNLSRRGTEDNLAWLRARNPKLEYLHADLRAFNDLGKPAVRAAFARADAVYHLAGQVAVTTSVLDPVDDFQVNAQGTLHVIEAIRRYSRDDGRHPVVIYASTNKVYGGMTDMRVRCVPRRVGGRVLKRYEYADLPHGADERVPLDFHSPYGCTKGYADQYVRDVARPDIYDMKTVVFRQSCVYGPRQFGIEDQGWVAWFTIACQLGIPATIYGDGRQTRDVLFVSDLVRAYELATVRIDRTKGQVFNIGGGPANTLSILELIRQLEATAGRKIARRFADWRPGDQKSFVCDIRRAKRVFGWEPRVDADEGVRQLSAWVADMVNRNPACFDFLR